MLKSLLSSVWIACCILPCTQSFASDPTESQIIPYLCPPQCWEVATNKKHSPRIKACFMLNIASGICPSINLAVEEIQCNEMQYLEAVKKLYENDMDTRWRDVGTIETKAGRAILTEIDIPSKWGAVRMMQSIYTTQNRAYIVTASALKKDFAKYYETFDACLKSFNITEDLLTAIPQNEQKEHLKRMIEKLRSEKSRSLSEKEQRLWNEQYIALEKYITSTFVHLGLHWQLLVMQSCL